MGSTRLGDADQRLTDKFLEAKDAYEAASPGHSIIVTCTFRSPEEQQLLYAKGRTAPGQVVTQIDGVTKLSNHNHFPARAIDFAVVTHGKISWDPAEYAPFGKLCEAQGLVWGGDWPHFKDNPHVELSDV